MFKDMKTGPYCRQNCYESHISVEEALEPSTVFVHKDDGRGEASFS